MKKRILFVVIIMLGSMLSACSLGTMQRAENPAKQAGNLAAQQSKQGQQAESGKTSPQTSEPQSAPNPTENQPNKPASPLFKKIPVYVEGETDLREAKLTKSEELGYQLYVLKGFSLEAEEPGRDVLLSQYDGEFFARIEKLDNQVNLAEYEKQQMAGFSQVGKVTERDPASLFLKEFRDAKFSFLVEAGYEKKNGPKTSINYLVKDFGGQLYAITIYIPLKEAAEGLSPSLWAMLSTIEVR